MRRFLIALAMVATPAAAQVTNYVTEGNLKPTHRVGCISLNEVKSDYSPADLFVGVNRCHKKRDYDKAIRLMLFAQMRGVFDSYRVTDRSAHQAIQVLAINQANAGGTAWEKGMSAAFERFGGQGGEGHKELCEFAKSVGAPDHSPNYMIQHGIKAVTGQDGDGLVDDFDAEKGWEKVITDYLKCGR